MSNLFWPLRENVKEVLFSLFLGAVPRGATDTHDSVTACGLQRQNRCSLALLSLQKVWSLCDFSPHSYFSRSIFRAVLNAVIDCLIIFTRQRIPMDPHSAHRFPAPKEGCRKPVLGV